ncbi:response regulator [Variovorax sp. J22P240]|uniref:response regulator n=1 Tax=unclassified Variovorax TaxID=663243 RepID=UPI002576D18F|nr:MULTISPECIES: response regulator [unclassified Variovorax]MDL9997517.1 response regulator [Variovorax sp. J22P240]MDM0051553.1 response regulator [Variovorax sp. J22R115]
MPKPAALRIVYVVDGDASVREGLSRLMDSAGLEARPCASVPEFLGQARGMGVACVLLDVWGARECEATVRTALHAVAKVLPVIALSSSDDPIARRLAKEMGAQSFFRKPVDGAALLDSIEWVMQGDGHSAPM